MEQQKTKDGTTLEHRKQQLIPAPGCWLTNLLNPWAGSEKREEKRSDPADFGLRGIEVEVHLPGRQRGRHGGPEDGLPQGRELLRSAASRLRGFAAGRRRELGFWFG